MHLKPMFLLAALVTPVMARDAAVTAVDRPASGSRHAHYVSNRAPLEPSRLIKLPVGSIRPGGWLAKQLRLQADGFHGHLSEVSDFVRKEENAWLSPTGVGKRGWEEVPYWLKGYLNCALVLDDEEMLAEAKVWIDGAIASQKDDGWFGPDQGRGGLATRLKGRDDLWPNMIMLFCLQDWHDATGDPRVIALMMRYFRYLHGVPEEKYLLGYWPKMRGGDNLFTIYWLYNRTGERWLLELAEKNHRRTARWDEDVINWHNVNIGQAFGEGATWWMQSGDESDLRSAYRNWQKVRDLYGQVPGGMFGSDENCRPGHDDPRQAVETCGMVEEMLSHETLVAITGDLRWADRCEDVAFNSLPAALTADMKGLRYLTAPNQVVSDRASKSPGIQNGGPMFEMNPHRHRCCQHNFGHGWPYFAQHLWYATPDNGLAAVFFSESTVTAKAGAAGDTVTIRQKAHYPFDGSIRFEFDTTKPVTFPLHLRVPGWCTGPKVKLNGEWLEVAAKPGQFVVIEREWKKGDELFYDLPMQVNLRTWKQHGGAVTVDRGPLTYSLKIGEEYRRSNDDRKWPSHEIWPTTPWNYALVLDENVPESSFLLNTLPWPEDDMPWTQENVPVRLDAPARLVPAWTLDRHGLCAELQDSPVETGTPVETVKLIPMGAARLRVSAFPVATRDGNGNKWVQEKKPGKLYEASASHTFGGDSVAAIADGILPKSSGDHSVQRHTFWPRTGSTEWLQAEFDEPRTLRVMDLYWFDDTGRGQCRVPKSFRLHYRDGDTWKDLGGPDGSPLKVEDALKKDQPNRIRVARVTTDAVRLEIDLRDGFSAGMLEWAID